MEVRNGKTTVWVPREAFESVQRLWKPEFNWIPVPVDRSLPPSHIAYIETNGPVSPLPPLARPPKTPLDSPSEQSPGPVLSGDGGLTPLPPLTPLNNNTVPKTPRTPLDLPPLNTGSLRPEEESEYFFGRSPQELETAITAGFSPGDDSDRPSTPSTATEPESPSTPRDIGSPGLSDPKIWRQSQQQQQQQQQQLDDAQANDDESPELVERMPVGQQQQPSKPPQLPLNDYASVPWKMYENVGDKWKMVDHRPEYRPAHPGVKPASWKRLDGKRDVKMKDHWRTRKRDDAHWNGSEKGFAVRLDMNLEMEVEIKGTVNGDITLSAEALYAL